MNNISLVAVVCIGVLVFAYTAGLEPLFVAIGSVGLLGYLAFAGGQAYKKKPHEQRRPWYMD